MSHYDKDARDLLIRLHDRRSSFSNYSVVIDNLLREAGLYNYVDSENMSFWDKLAYGAHLAPTKAGMDLMVFHERQADVYHSLRRRENVVLSAPTSFGKSVIIESMLLISDFKTVVIIVPTIALIDQVRRRLSAIVGDNYKIITSRSQRLSQKNIFILTQERFLEFEEPPKPDFWIVDEFYKISEKNGDDRWKSLNIAVYKLLKTQAQFYLIGPNMGGLLQIFGEEVKYKVYIETMGTVSSNIFIDINEDAYRGALRLCQELEGPTLVFCSSPTRAARMARELSLLIDDNECDRAVDFYKWCVENYGADWHFSRAVKKGIGIHHGRIPRSISQIAVEMFNSGVFNILICTSTLIEGVNTRAKNIIILDNKINNKRIDFFTYNNIKGRSGRMGYHPVGNVYMFSIPPSEELLEFDVPFVKQTPLIPINLISCLEEKDLSGLSLSRLLEYESLTGIPRQLLKDNISIPQHSTELLFKYLNIPSNFETQNINLRVVGFPSYAQIENVCHLMWDIMGLNKRNRTGVRSHRQLAFILNFYMKSDTNKTVKLLSRQFLGDDDERIGNAIAVKRNLIAFEIPNYLRAIESIFNAIAILRQSAPINLSSIFGFISSEKMRILETLDEYGLPIEIALKLPQNLFLRDIDYSLALLGNISMDSYNLSDFERTIFSDFKSNIGQII